MLAAFVCLAPLTLPAQSRDLSLAECIEMSHSYNPDVTGAALDALSARAQRKEALSLWFPQVSIKAGGFHSLNPLLRIGIDDVLGSSDAAANLRHYINTTSALVGLEPEWSALEKGWVGGVNVIQPVFAGGRIANGNALAALGVRASETRREMALRDNDESVTQKYWTIVTLSGKEAALQQALEMLGSMEKDVESAIKAGIRSDTDLMQLKLKKNEMENNMKQLRRGVKLAKMDLFNGIGLEYRVLELDSLRLSDGLDSLGSPESHYRDFDAVAASLAESRLLEMSVESKQLEKKMALGEALPQVALGGMFGYAHTIGDPTSINTVFATLSIPLSDWGRTSSKLERCRNEIEKAQSQKDYLEKQLLLKVNKAWVDLECAWDSRENAEQAVELSRVLEERKRAEYESGVATMSELLHAQTEFQAALSSFVDASAGYCRAVSAWHNL